LGLSVDWKVVDLKDKVRLHRNGHTAHIYKENMYVFGGINKENKPTNEVWCLDQEFNWTQRKVSGDVFGIED